MTNELIAKIKAEIERRIALYSSLSENTVNPNRIDEDRQILSFLSTLESEKPMQDDLEKELDKWRHEHFHGKRDNHFSGEYLERTSQLDLARHFAEWGYLRATEKYDEIEYNRQRAEASGCSEIPKDLDKAARKAAVAPFNFDLDEEHLYEYPYLPIAEQKFKEGAKWSREQMMKEAVEGHITNAGGEFGYDVAAFRFDENHTYTVLLPHEEGRKHGDKVRVIVLKKED